MFVCLCGARSIANTSHCTNSDPHVRTSVNSAPHLAQVQNVFLLIISKSTYRAKFSICCESNLRTVLGVRKARASPRARGRAGRSCSGRRRISSTWPAPPSQDIGRAVIPSRGYGIGASCSRSPDKAHTRTHYIYEWIAPWQRRRCRRCGHRASSPFTSRQSSSGA